MAKRHKMRIEVGRNSEGKPEYKWIDGRNQQEMLVNAAKALLEAGALGILEQPPEQPKDELATQISFEAYAQEWYKTFKKPGISLGTANSYENILNMHIYPHIGGMALGEITTADLQGMFNREADNGLAYSSLKKMRILVNLVFDSALEDGVIERNPIRSKRFNLPDGKVKKRQALTRAHMLDIEANLTRLKQEDEMVVGLLLYTGMRRGEALALRWENIDFAEKLVHVTQAVTFENNRPIIGSPKSEAGIRSIPLLQPLEALLNRQLCREGFLIGGDTPWTESTFQRAWERISKTIDLHSATPHVFRHSFLTALNDEGLNPKEIQVIGGHSDVRMTMEIYVHAQQEQVKKAAGKMGGIFAAAT